MIVDCRFSIFDWWCRGCRRRNHGTGNHGAYQIMCNKALACSHSLWRDAYLRLWRDRTAVVCFAVICVYAAIAVVAPLSANVTVLKCAGCAAPLIVQRANVQHTGSAVGAERFTLVP